MIKKILKRTFAIIFFLFVAFCCIALIIDLDKSVAYNIGKLLFCVFFTGGLMLSIKWLEEWKEGK